MVTQVRRTVARIARRLNRRFWSKAKLCFTKTRVRVDRFLGRPLKKHIVICGYPRSGTSLLYNMLTSALPNFQFDSFENSCLGYVDSYMDCISKRPLDIFDIHKLIALNIIQKKLYILVLIRDPRDILTSRHPRVPQDYFIGYNHSYRVDGPDGYDPELVYPGFKDVYDAIEALKMKAEIEVVFVRYEDLVRFPDRTQGELSSGLNTLLEGSFSSFHRDKDKLAYRYEGKTAALDQALVLEDKPVDESRAGKWRRAEHRERIQEQFEAFPELLEIVREYGYETDDSWFDSFLQRPHEEDRQYS